LRSPLEVVRLEELSKQLFDRLSACVDEDIRYERCGRLWLLREPAMLQEGKTAIDRCATAGISVEYIDQEGLRQLEPWLDVRTTLGAAYLASDGQVDPFLLLQAMSRKIKEKGGTFYFHTNADKLISTEECVYLETTGGRLRAGTIVVAAGLWSSALVEPLGVSLDVRPVRGQLLVTEPMPRLLGHVISPGLSQCWRGNVLLGTSSEEVGHNNSNTLPVLRHIAEDSVAKAPALREIRVIRCFSGLRPMPLRGWPLLGRLPGHERIYVAVTHNGLSLSQAIGETMARWIVEGTRDSLLTPFSLSRGGV
jgi:glycine/D-amino acid oxidase-like deaminating enzyme